MSLAAWRPPRLIDTMELLNYACARACVCACVCVYLGERWGTRWKISILALTVCFPKSLIMGCINKIYTTKYNLILKVDMSDKTKEEGQLWVCVCVYIPTHTHPACEPWAVFLQSVWSGVSGDAVGLWLCFTHSDTHAGSSGTRDHREKRKTDRRNRRSVSP